MRIHGQTAVHHEFECKYCDEVLPSKARQVVHTKEVHGVEM